MLRLLKNKLLLNFFSLGTVQGISSLIQLIVIPHVILAIGVERYGMIAVAQVVMFFLTILTDYSFNQTATKAIALNRNNAGFVSKVFSTVFFTKLFLCAVAFILLAVITWIIPLFRSQFELYLLGFAFVAGQAVMIPWFFQGLEKMHFIAFFILVSRVIFALLVFIFIRSAADTALFLFFLGLGSFIAGLFSILTAFRIYPLQWRIPYREDLVMELKGGWHIALSHLSNSICHYSGVLILRLFATDLVVGYYSVAERIFFTIKQVFHAFSQAIYPRVCQLVEIGREEVYRFFRRVFFPFLVVVIIMCSVIFVFAAEILYFFMGDGNVHAIYFLRVFCVIAIVVCMNIPGTVVLLATNRNEKYFRIYGLASVINIVSHLVLAYFYLADGTVAAVFITEFFITMALTTKSRY